MSTKTPTLNVRPGRDATLRLACRRVQTLLLTAVTLAVLSLTTSVRADRVGHDVSAGNVVVTNSGGYPTQTDAGTEISVAVAVNGFDIINNHNVSDHKIKVGATEYDDVTNGVAMFAISQNVRNNQGSNMTHIVAVNGSINATNSYEAATFGNPLNANAAKEDNVNFAAAVFPYATWLGGYAFISSGSNGGFAAGITNDSLIGSPSLVWGTHVIHLPAAGEHRIDLRPFGIDSRRDGVLLVNGAKNEANYALSYINDAEDDNDGTWNVYVHDSKANGGNFEEDPFTFVFVPKTNTAVISGMFMGDGSAQIYSGTAPAFNVSWRTDIAAGTYELKIPGHSPDDGVLIISAAGGDSYNGDNIVTYEANAARDGWIIQSRDLPNGGLQSLPDTEPVCSFVFIPAEKPGITVTPNKNLMTTENGGTATFTVTINGYPKPTANVTLNLSSSNTGEGTVSPSTLTFTPADWNVPQTVTITGVDDGVVDGTHPYTINLSSTISTDPNCNGLVPGNVQAINIDNEAGISLDKNSVTTTEAGGTDTFSVWLNTPPTADVTLTLASSVLTEATVSPTTLTFTPANYNMPQVVTVTGVDDLVQDGPAAYFVVTALASSLDPAYNNFNALDVAGQNMDNDHAGVIVPPDRLTVSEPNTTATFPLVLSSKPTANVTVNCVSSDTTEGTVTPSVTFTPANWNVPQNITVTAVDDLVNDGTVEFSIITTVTSSDPVYAAVNPDDVAVQTLDNEAVLTLPSGDFTYGIGEPAKGIDGYATVTDPDTANYNSGGLTVTITAGGSSSDRLDVRSLGTGAGQISVSGSTVSYQGIAFGTKSGGTGTTPLTITFNNVNATVAAAQALVRAVSYQNVAAAAGLQSRTVSFALADGRSGVSTATKNIILRLMRIDSYQQEADGGFGPYTNALDTQIHHKFPTQSFPSGYGDNWTTLWIDYDDTSLIPTDQMQCFVKFTNLFGVGPGQIPPGAKIVFANLIMNVSNTGHGARFNRMLQDWDEAVTFDSLGNGIQLDDVEAVSGTNAFLSDQAHATTTGTGLRTIGVTADVQAWSDGAPNYGWVMSPWEGGNNGTAFSPCESTNVTLRPRLRIGWLPPSVSVASFRDGVNGYTSQVDTEIREALPDTTYSANTTLSPDPQVNSTPLVNRQQVLVRFDNIIGSGAGQVPANATIQAAVLDLTSISSAAQGAGATFHPLLKSWDATTATWNTWVDGISADGVEAAASPTTSLPVEGYGATVQPTSYAVELTADVQAWVNGSRANNGWVLMPWPGGNNGWAFNSAEASPVSTRPQLRVYFEPGVVMLPPVHNGSNVKINFTGAGGRTYTVQRCTNLGGTWSNLGPATTATDGTGTYTDNAPLAGAAFYRVAYP